MSEKKLGLMIAALRKNRNWLQNELAEKVGMSTSTVAMWETGKRDPDSEMIAKLSSIFGVSSDHLLGIENLSDEKKFSVRLKQLREERGLTQKELGEKLGIPESSIEHYENIDEFSTKKIKLPNVNRLSKLASFFGVQYGYLAGYKDYKNENQLSFFGKDTLQKDVELYFLNSDTIEDLEIKKRISLFEAIEHLGLPLDSVLFDKNNNEFQSSLAVINKLADFYGVQANELIFNPNEHDNSSIDSRYTNNSMVYNDIFYGIDDVLTDEELDIAKTVANAAIKAYRKAMIRYEG